MHFDYLIVLVFGLVGGLLALVGPAASPKLQVRKGVDLDPRSVRVGLGFVLGTAGAAFLLAWALVLRDCLHDRGPAQSVGIGASAVAIGGLFLLILLLGLLHLWKSR